MAKYTPVWEGKNWILFVNDKDDFVIFDNETQAEIEIMKEDKQEFQQLMAVLSNELAQESTDYRKDK